MVLSEEENIRLANFLENIVPVCLELSLKGLAGGMVYYALRLWWETEFMFLSQTGETFATLMGLAFLVLLFSIPNQFGRDDI